ncbi:MAG: valine--tRNA ligase [Rhodobacteraceae bacterium]|nr:valine--tRNA ligase [Paracoccaceae bacterium]
MPSATKYQAGEIEARVARKWDQADAFAAGANAKPGSESFCIMIPPPNVTGLLHMGHAFNNTIQDILIRWHRMRGFDVLWQPGQDHAGIATQMVVERDLEDKGKAGRRELGREEFLKRVWQWKDESGGAIISQLQRLGASCDWSRNRFTMDPGFHHAVLTVFVELYRKGVIYRGKRLVNWDPHFETAISDLEVEQTEVDGKLWRFRYPLDDGSTYAFPVEFDEQGEPVAWEQRNYLTVATTRPETILGDTGVAVHPHDERYRGVIGKRVRLPLVNRLIPIVADPHADPEKGTGAVKITPAHDFNDWAVGQRCELRAINVMTTAAAMNLANNEDFLEDCDVTDEALALHGLDRYAAREQIVALARMQGWLEGEDDDRHVVPHGDRSKVAIEPYLTDQWFVDAKQLVGPAIDAVQSGRTRILPVQYEKTYFRWLESIEPWCISRQLWWGHQIPVWYDSDGNQYCAVSEEEAVEMAGGRELTRDPDVLDTWFSSGLWPIGTLGWPQETKEYQRYFPTDVLVTGFDIIFFWVARMMMMQLAIVGTVPFHTVYVHALVRDAQGRKMSKSIGNVIDPIDLIDKYGADAVRFTLASMAAMGRDLRLSEDRVAGYRNFGTKIWNVVRYAEINRCHPEKDFSPASAQSSVNRWIISQTVQTAEMIDESIKEFRFNDAANRLYAFVWGHVCDWYVEFSKELLQDPDAGLVAETRATLAWILDECLALLHPFMPFISEELWGRIPRDRMLVHTDWPRHDSTLLKDANADHEMAWTIQLIEDVRSTRTQMRVPAGERIELLRIEEQNKTKGYFTRNRALIMRLARLSAVSQAHEVPRDAALISVEGSVFCLPLAHIIDVDLEKNRLDADLKKTRSDMSVLQSRLNNEGFLTKAPEDVIQKDRARLGILSEQAATYETALQRFLPRSPIR